AMSTTFPLSKNCLKPFNISSSLPPARKTGSGVSGWPKIIRKDVPRRRFWRSLREADFDVGTLFQAHGIHEANVAFVVSQDHGVRAGAFAEEAHAVEQVALGDAGASKDDLFPRGEIVCVVNALGVLDAHFREALFVLGLAHDEACDDLAVEAAQGGRGENALG